MPIPKFDELFNEVLELLSDKNESSALLIPGASENKIIDDNLSEAGKFIKSVIKD